MLIGACPRKERHFTGVDELHNNKAADLYSVLAIGGRARGHIVCILDMYLPRLLFLNVFITL